MMEKVMKTKVSEAKGRVLDYLVAQAAGMKIYRSKSGRWMTANYGEFNHRHGTPWFEPTISWEQGGPIIEREGINLRALSGALWEAEAWSAGSGQYLLDGPTPLIAAMRAYVASKLGDEVEVPDEMAS
jgi:hypothetical protein